MGDEEACSERSMSRLAAIKLRGWTGEEGSTPSYLTLTNHATR